MTCYLQNKVTRFQKWKGGEVNVGHDSTNNIMADVCLQKEDCLPKRKRFIPIMDKEKESYGHQQDVCLLAEWRSMMAVCSVGGYWYGGKQREHFTVMRLTSVANVSFGPLGKFHGQHSNVNPEVSKNNVFIPVIRQASELCWVGGGGNVQAVCPQVLAVDAAGTDGGRDLTFASARFTGVCAAQKYQ